jgi:hypothetical protein
MLDESFPYKRQMRRELGAIRNKPIAEDETAWVRLERFVFWSAFVIRKFSEAKKLSDEFEAERFQVRRFPKTDPNDLQDFMNADKIDRFYSLGRPESRTVDPLWIVNQLIHSFVYMPEAEDGPPLGLYFNSDNSRHESLFHIAWEEFVRLIQGVVDDGVVSTGFNRLTGELWKSREIPDDARTPGATV